MFKFNALQISSLIGFLPYTGDYGIIESGMLSFYLNYTGLGI